MKFKEIRIRLMEWGDFNGQIVATLSIEGKAADMQITIPEPQSLRILQACGEIVADAGAEQAAKFREEFIAAISPQNVTVQARPTALLYTIVARKGHCHAITCGS